MYSPPNVRLRIRRAGITLRCRRCAPDGADLPAFAADADVLWFWGDEVSFTVKMLERLPRLKALFRAGSGMDSLPVEAATRQGVAVCNSPESIAEAVAEHTVTLLLALARRIPEQDDASRAGRCRES